MTADVQHIHSAVALVMVVCLVINSRFSQEIQICIQLIAINTVIAILLVLIGFSFSVDRRTTPAIATSPTL